MRRVGLTGGIGTGKSYVRQRFALRGLPTIDADEIARDLVAPGTPGLAQVVAAFGPAVLQADGTLDRKALAAIVFADRDRRTALEAIIHPAVRAAIDTFFRDEQARGTALAVADIPLLFETGRERDFDVVVVAACEPDEQVRRVMRRDGATEREARARLGAQLPIADKVRRAHYVIRTDGPFAETDRLVDEVIRALHDADQTPPPPAAR